jgi:hypothetical protein
VRISFDILADGMKASDMIQSNEAYKSSSLKSSNLYLIEARGTTGACSLLNDMVYAENSTYRFCGVLQRAEFIPKLIQRFQESPEDVLADFESIRKHGTAT